MEHQSLPALALVLAAAVACGLFMSRMRMPAAAGFILVGVALGPSGAGLIDHLRRHRDLWPNWAC